MEKIPFKLNALPAEMIGHTLQWFDTSARIIAMLAVPKAERAYEAQRLAHAQAVLDMLRKIETQNFWRMILRASDARHAKDTPIPLMMFKFILFYSRPNDLNRKALQKQYKEVEFLYQNWSAELGNILTIQLPIPKRAAFVLLKNVFTSPVLISANDNILRDMQENWLRVCADIAEVVKSMEQPLNKLYVRPPFDKIFSLQIGGNAPHHFAQYETPYDVETAKYFNSVPKIVFEKFCALYRKGVSPAQLPLPENSMKQWVLAFQRLSPLNQHFFLEIIAYFSYRSYALKDLFCKLYLIHFQTQESARGISPKLEILNTKFQLELGAITYTSLNMFNPSERRDCAFVYPRYRNYPHQLTKRDFLKILLHPETAIALACCVRVLQELPTKERRELLEAEVTYKTQNLPVFKVILLEFLDVLLYKKIPVLDEYLQFCNCLSYRHDFFKILREILLKDEKPRLIFTSTGMEKAAEAFFLFDLALLARSQRAKNAEEKSVVKTQLDHRLTFASQGRVIARAGDMSKLCLSFLAPPVGTQKVDSPTKMADEMHHTASSGLLCRT